MKLTQKLKQNKTRLAVALASIVNAHFFGAEGMMLMPMMILALDDFGEKFAAKTLRRIYQNAVFPSITNTNYPGELKNAGDRLNILQLPGDSQLEDYVTGTDMANTQLYDLEDVLVVEKRKSHSFTLDRLEDLFTYVDDAADSFVENVAKTVEREIDTYVLANAAFAKAGSWVGIDVRVTGSSRDTEASIATTATGGTLSIQGADGAQGEAVEHGDGTLDLGGFTTADIGKPVRLTSGTTWATEWYRISAFTNTVTVSITNWDTAVAGQDIPNGDILRGLGGGFQFTGGAANQDGKPTTEGGWGYELQAARATALTATNAYEVITLLAEKLDDNEIPDTDRHLTVTPAVVTLLKQAAELQPAIAMAYEGVILNGKVGRVGGFDIHVAAGSRVSTRLGHSTAAERTDDTQVDLTDGTRATQLLANHISFCTFAYKWAESRVVDAEQQFAKKYQALHLYGVLVPGTRRRALTTAFVTI